jgi:hypothetical protein
MTCKYKFPDSNNIERCFLYDGTEEYLPTLAPMECNKPETKKCEAYADGDNMIPLDQISIETLGTAKIRSTRTLSTKAIF